MTDDNDNDNDNDDDDDDDDDDDWWDWNLSCPALALLGSNFYNAFGKYKLNFK